MKISSICEDKFSNIWIGTRNGLNKYNGDKLTNYYKKDGLCGNRILNIQIRQNNELVILTSEGLSFYDGITFKNKRYSFPKVLYNLQIINDIIYIYDYTSWIKFENGSFSKITQPPSNQFKLTKPEKPFIKKDTIFYKTNILIDSKVKEIQSPSVWFTDTQENIWIGSDNGVHFFSKNYFEHVDEKMLPNIWSIAENKDNYFFSSFGSGLFKMNKETEEVIKVIQPENDEEYFQGIATDKSGQIYLSNSRSLIKLNGETLSYIFEWNPTFAATYDSTRNCIVFGTYNGIIILKENGELDSITNTNLIHDNNYIMNISIDNNNEYWLGSYKGITKLNPDLRTSKNYDLPNGNGIFSSHPDKSGNIWLGGEQGLFIYDPIKDSIKSIDSQLLNAQVKAIKEWDSHLIINTIDQIILFDHKAYLNSGEIHTRFLNESNSYLGFEPSLDGLYVDNNNDVWVLSGASLDILKVKSIDIENNLLKAKISRVGNEVVSNLLDNKNQFDTIYLKENKNINFSIDAIGINRPKKILYRYRVASEKWHKWSTQNSYFIKELKHGTHKLEVEIGPTDIKPNPQKDIIYIKIHLPFHQRQFFIPCLICILGLMLALLFFLTIRNVKQKEKYKQQIQEARYLKSQLLLSEMNPHFIFNVLATIQNKILIGDKDSANKKLIQLSQLIRNFLSSSYKSNQSNKNLENEITLAKEIELLNSYIEFEKSISNDHFDFKITYEGQKSLEEIMIPPILIQPHVENAIKHGMLPNNIKGELLIHFNLNEERLHCIIKDNGVGFDFKDSNKGPKEKHISLGSKLVNDRIEILNNLGYKIKIDTNSEVGKGTEIHIVIIDKF